MAANGMCRLLSPPLCYPEQELTVQQGQAAMCAKKQGCLEDLSVVGVDIGKDVFHMVGFDRSGQVVLRREIKRFALQETFDALPRCIVGMEACLSPHLVSRGLRKLGFEPRIIPAIYVKPFNKGQKKIGGIFSDGLPAAQEAHRRLLQYPRTEPGSREQGPGFPRSPIPHRKLLPARAALQPCKAV